jgi:hypothetical protein
MLADILIYLKKDSPMRRIFLLSLCVFGLIQGAVSARQSPPPAEVSYRFINLTEQATVDLYRNQGIAFSGAAQGTESATRTLSNDGQHTFALYAANQNPSAGLPLAELELGQRGGDFLLFALQDAQGIRLAVYEYNNDPVPTNRTRFSFWQASPVLPANVALVGQNGDLLNDPQVNLAQAEKPWTTTLVPSAIYQVEIRESVEGPALAATTLNLTLANSILVVAYGARPLRFYQFNFPLPSQATVRFFHAGRISPPLDVYANGRLLLQNLAYGAATPYILLTPNTYTLTAYESGADPARVTPLWTGQTPITASSPLTAVLLGEANLRLLTYADDHFGIESGQTRYRFINAALNTLLVTLGDSRRPSEPLVRDIQYVLASGNRLTPATPATLTVSETGGQDYLTLDYVFEANTAVTFVLVGNALVEGSMKLVPLTWSWREAFQTETSP